MSYIVGVDIGGTFTDTVVIESEKRTIVCAKALSTPPEYEEGTINSLKAAAEELNLKLDGLLKETVSFVLGTTIATNAIMTRSGVKTGFITTKGFEDLLLME